METKVCSKCGEEKKISEFYKRKESKNGLRKECRDCCRLRSKNWISENKERFKETQKNWQKNNPDKIKIIQEKYNKSEKTRERKNLWARNNRKNGYEWFNNKYHTDVLFNLKIKFRRRIYMSLRTNNLKKTDKMINLLGCTFLEFKKYIENQFTENMTWDLVMSGKIHLDHIIPLSIAQSEEELYKLCHYTNLQPLWAEENLKKSNKIVEQLNKSNGD